MADLEVISENITELLTNSVNISSLFYDLFISPVPMEVELQQYLEDGTLKKIRVPNRAKDRTSSVKTGSISPEGTYAAPMGTLYINNYDHSVYIKVQGDDDDPSGWVVISNQDSISAYISNYLRDNEYLTTSNLDRVLEEREYITSNELSDRMNKHIPTMVISEVVSTNPLLEANQAYSISPGTSISFTLSTPENKNIVNKILVQLYLSPEFIEGNGIINFGTTDYFDLIDPNYTRAGYYNLIYEYDSKMESLPSNNGWVCGLILKRAI